MFVQRIKNTRPNGAVLDQVLKEPLLCLPCVFITRYLEEQKTENGKDKEQKQTNTDKEKMKEKGSFSDTGLGDTKMKSDPFAPKTDTEKSFRGSQSLRRYKLRDDFEKMADFIRMTWMIKIRTKLREGRNWSLMMNPNLCRKS